MVSSCTSHAIATDGGSIMPQEHLGFRETKPQPNGSRQDDAFSQQQQARYIRIIDILFGQLVP